MLFSLLQIAVSINTTHIQDLLNQGKLYPEAPNPPAVSGLFCIAVAFGRQLGSAQCLIPLLKGKYSPYVLDVCLI